MERKFYTLDVFTDQALAGNPLAVVLDSDGLDDEKMQAIAGEFNLSETVFVYPPETDNGTARIRIFTPAHELPFAGHPTVGTAVLLSHLNQLDDGAELILEEKVGPVDCVISDKGNGRTVRFGLPRVSMEVESNFDPDLVSQAIGTSCDHLIADQLGVWDGGVCYTMVPLNSIEAVKNLTINIELVAKAFPFIEFRTANPYVFCEGGEADDADFHARMFAPNFGIPEDPATGSAVASFSGWIAQYKMSETESRVFKIEQGYEMGRPSQIYLDIEKRDGVVISAGISGAAVIISEGVLRL